MKKLLFNILILTSLLLSSAFSQKRSADTITTAWCDSVNKLYAPVINNELKLWPKVVTDLVNQISFYKIESGNHARGQTTRNNNIAFCIDKKTTLLDLRVALHHELMHVLAKLLDLDYSNKDIVNYGQPIYINPTPGGDTNKYPLIGGIAWVGLKEQVNVAYSQADSRGNDCPELLKLNYVSIPLNEYVFSCLNLYQNNFVLALRGIKLGYVSKPSFKKYLVMDSLHKQYTNFTNEFSVYAETYSIYGHTLSPRESDSLLGNQNKILMQCIKTVKGILKELKYNYFDIEKITATQNKLNEKLADELLARLISGLMILPTGQADDLELCLISVPNEKMLSLLEHLKLGDQYIFKDAVLRFRQWRDYGQASVKYLQNEDIIKQKLPCTLHAPER